MTMKKGSSRLEASDSVHVQLRRCPRLCRVTAISFHFIWRQWPLREACDVHVTDSRRRYRWAAGSLRNQQARLSRIQPTWVPASEIRGERLFFHFKEDMIQNWVKK